MEKTEKMMLEWFQELASELSVGNITIENLHEEIRDAKNLLNQE